MKEFLRRTWAQINLDAIENNILQIKSILKPGTLLCATVKADCYGHGAVVMMEYMMKYGIRYFGVASLNEAMELRRFHKDGEILVLGLSSDHLLKYGVDNNITQACCSLRQAKILSECATPEKPAKIQIKVDTGMHRLGFAPTDAASIALIGGADGPMVLFASLMMSKELFVPITIVAYLYLSLTYGGYPFLIKAMIPKRLRVIQPQFDNKIASVTKEEKLVFSIVACTILCLLFPMAAPLFVSFFLGVAIREADMNKYVNMLENTVLYFSTFMLGLLLGVLCDASTILNPDIVCLRLSVVCGFLFEKPVLNCDCKCLRSVCSALCHTRCAENDMCCADNRERKKISRVQKKLCGYKGFTLICLKTPFSKGSLWFIIQE